jgi:hypothetical protein
MTALDELEKTLAAGPDLGIITLRKGDVLDLLSAAREGERMREALLLALPYVEDAIAASPADQEFIRAALQSEKPHDH